MTFVQKPLGLCISAAAFVLAASGAATAGPSAGGADCAEPAGDAQIGARESHLSCLVEHAHYYDAITYGESALRSGVESAAILSEVGAAYAAVQDRDQAEHYLEGAHGLRPDDPRIAGRLADVLYERILSVSPEERQARAQNGLGKCVEDNDLSEQEAADLVTALAARAENLLNTAIIGFDDPMSRYNARSLLAMLHITVEGEQRVPELATLVDEVAAQASVTNDVQLADFAAMLMLNLSTAYRAHGDVDSALKTADRALATAHSASVKRLVSSGTAKLRGDDSTVEMEDVLVSNAPSCQKTFDLNVSN